MQLWFDSFRQLSFGPLHAFRSLDFMQHDQFIAISCNSGRLISELILHALLKKECMPTCVLTRHVAIPYTAEANNSLRTDASKKFNSRRGS